MTLNMRVQDNLVGCVQFRYGPERQRAELFTKWGFLLSSVSKRTLCETANLMLRFPRMTSTGCLSSEKTFFSATC
jgi:hypothetical protein